MSRFVCVCVFVVFAPDAQAFDCKLAFGTLSPYTHDYPPQDGKVNYRINASGASSLTVASGQSSLTASEFRNAAVLSADAWGENGNAGWFNYTGTSSLSVLPADFGSCIVQGVNYDLVRIRTDCSSADYPIDANAHIVASCRIRPSGAPKDIAIQREIVILSHNKNSLGVCTPIPWSFGVIGPGPNLDRDIVGTITHEFGHALGLDHPTSGDAIAVMSGTELNNDKRRDFREYDLTCLHEEIGTRSASGKRRLVNGATVSPTLTTYTTPLAVHRVGVGRTYVAGGSPLWQWSSPIREVTCTRWSRGIGPIALSPCLDTSGQINQRVGIGYVDSVWNELGRENQRILFSDYLDLPSPSAGVATRRVRYVRSLSEFATGTQFTGGLHHCNAMGTWTAGGMTCSGGTSPVSSARAVGIGRLGLSQDDQESVTLIAWADNTGTGLATDRRVRVAISTVSQTVVPVPDFPAAYGGVIRTNVAPAVACSLDTAVPFHCILAYVDSATRDNRVKVVRFDVGATTTRYVVQMETPSVVYLPNTSFTTASRIAAWRSEDYFWLAAKQTTTAGQPIHIYRSLTGSSWTKVGTDWGTTIGGPSAVSWAVSNDNVIVTQE